jgi:hypothetical protein
MSISRSSDFLLPKNRWRSSTLIVPRIPRFPDLTVPRPDLAAPHARSIIPLPSLQVLHASRAVHVRVSASVGLQKPGPGICGKPPTLRPFDHLLTAASVEKAGPHLLPCSSKNSRILRGADVSRFSSDGLTNVAS